MASADNVRIGFVGAGTLGRGLALALDGVGCDVVAVSSRTLASAEWLAERIDGCVSHGDGAGRGGRLRPGVHHHAGRGHREGGGVGDLARRPGRRALLRRGVHVELLDAAAGAGASVGAMHPFQTFAGLSDPTEAARRLSGVTFAVSATGWLADYLPSLAERLDGRAITIPDELRPLYHASAVLACGYVGTLLDAAIGLWARMGFTEEDGVRAVAPLSRATIEAIAATGPVNAVTGPAVRGDADTIAAHLSLLSEHAPHLLTLYRELTVASIPLARAKGVGEGELARLRRTAQGPG